MPEPLIVFDHVWKKFRKGERHDSLRDLLPALAGGLFRARRAEELDQAEFWALRDVSFEVSPGETLGIIGRNGAGKSTTLKLLTRILKPTSGQSHVRGRVGALIELAAGFHGDLTGRENVFLQGAIMGLRRHEIEQRFDEIVDFAGTGEFIDTQVKRYSSGMQARLGFAVAAHLDPSVLLIDEVLAVGDISFQQKCYERLKEYKRAGVAIAFVSHNMQAISLLCDRVLYLRPGQPPILDRTAAAVAAYVSADVNDCDPRARVDSARLTVEGATDALSSPVLPGDRLSIDFQMTAVADLPRCGLGLIVRRADGLVVFQGGSTLDGLAASNIRSGDRIPCKVTFRANLLRGTYSVALALYDEERQWPIADLGVLGGFVVEETTRYQGVAELEPRYEFTAASALR